MDAMMEKKEILESGILERYLLGDVSEMEQLQVERYLQDTEIRNHYRQLEIDFEKLAMENAIAPPTKVKNSIMAQISAKTEPTKNERLNRSGLKSYLAIAAALALLFGVSSFWLYMKLNSTETQLELVRSQNEVINEELEDLVKNYDAVINDYQIISDPNTVKLIMTGNEKSPNASAISYVNHIHKTVYLNATELPELPKDRDYQLWADVEGEMINMGIIPEGTALFAMNYIDHAESFNITIEPAGGSDHPTVEQLISNVYLN